MEEQADLEVDKNQWKGSKNLKFDITLSIILNNH